MISKEKEYKLPKEFAGKWVKALRSGDYKQGNGQLYNTTSDSYCCLGVACNVAGYATDIKKHGGSEYIDESTNNYFPKVPKLLKQETIFTEIVANMNDQGASFDEIAKWIEKNVEFA